MLNSEVISARIKGYRLMSNMTQEQMAELLSISRTTYIYWENNPMKVPLERLEAIANICNTDIKNFFC